MGNKLAQNVTKATISAIAFFALSGCLILPGEFASTMTVRENGDFSFSYKGQIQLVGLANLLNEDLLGNKGSTEFKAICWNDAIEPAEENSETMKTEVERDDVAVLGNSTFALLPSTHWRSVASGFQDSATPQAEGPIEETMDTAASAQSWNSSERECTPDEVKQQKSAWDIEQTEKKKRDEQGRKMAEMMLGGIDPENPETVKRFTREVERLAAWHKVEHLGNGVFLVDYSTSGKLADDYAFPVIPRYALGEPMIHITRWDNGRLRVEAPAFRSDPEMSLSSIIGMGTMASGLFGKSGADKMPAEPIAIKGRFTLTTDARILANNSEDGPEEVDGGMQTLGWDIGPALYGAPMALLKLAR